MIRAFLSGALGALAVTASIAIAQTPAGQAAGCIVRDQAEKLVATLQERNDQVRDLSTKLRDAQQKAAAAEANTAELAVSRKALAVAEVKNRELVEIGEAILTDYEKMDLGKKMLAGEPLTQLYRVKLENKLQEFRDQIATRGFYQERELEAARAPAQSGAPQAN